jgi:hypothetical protein
MAGDPNSPQVLASLLTEEEATLLVGHLDSLGIHADIWGASTSSVAWPEVPRNVQVVVRQADLEQARAALDHIQQNRSKRASEEGEE